MNWYTKYIISQTNRWDTFPQNIKNNSPDTSKEYNDKAVPFIEKQKSNSGWNADYNLYHVTTNLTSVISSEKLKSRNELGNEVGGLGGGFKDEASNMVSVTYSIERARKIYADLIFVCNVVRGKAMAHDILNYALEGTYEFGESKELMNILLNYVPKNVIDKIWSNIFTIKEIDKYIIGGPMLYEFLQKLEDAAFEYGIDESVMSITGFTASYENMIKILPENIAILQLSAKKEAKPEHITGEMELRFYPSDLKIIRYMKP